MSALVSIVIPVYNAAPYLEECLRSVSNQTYSSIEVIIINDGSTDNSEEIIEKLFRNDSRFTLYTQENHGLGYTRNRGIHLSKGEFIFFLDSDDLLPTNAIEKLTEAIQKSDADYAVGEVLRLNEERKYPPKRHTDFKLYKKNKVTTLNESPELLQDSIACNKLWKTAFLKSNALLFIEGKYYEDLNLTLKAAVLAQKIAVIRNTVYYWRIRETDGRPSITQQQMKLKNTLDRLEALTRNREWLISVNAAPHIIEENDLKSLLDVLRLHVSQYALISEDERRAWELEMISFLNLIPPSVIDKLPIKEKLLYQLLMEQNFHDLSLFSQMDTNTEKEKIVFQEGNSFILRGKNREYNVTSFIKPNLVVEEIIRKDNVWLINGMLTIPKSSIQTDGSYYIESREMKNKIEIHSFTSRETVHSSLYPFETQHFKMKFQTTALPAMEKDDVFDFYYRIKNEQLNTHQARIRLKKNVNPESMIQLGSRIAILYRTEHGNLSLSIQRNSLKRKIKQIVKMFLLK
jgi:glycosyltransferase involved in cell wall biosynthesis